MKIYFYEMGGVSHHVELLQKVAEARGHQVGEPADVVFMMCYQHLSDCVGEAAKHAKASRCVLLLRVIYLDPWIYRKFWKSREVMDIVSAPYTEDDAHELFAALEQGDTSRIQ